MITNYLNKNTKTAPLAVFRIFFGLLMVISIVRFWANGWIKSIYIEPKFFFTYYGFDFVKPLGEWMYLLFAVCGISAFLVMIGYKYRLAIITFFLSFTYIELIDKTPYLNHYYFVSLMAFLLIFLPSNAYFSVDAFQHKNKQFTHIPKWTVDAVKLLIGIVYVYAGLAKLNSDWLIEAQPLKIWLQSKYDVPIIGGLLRYNWVHYFFSWFGAFYDLTIPFFLLYQPTRKLAYVAVVVFHLMTSLLFPIGVFPYVMIVGSLIFFKAEFHEKVIWFISTLLKIKRPEKKENTYFSYDRNTSKFIKIVLAVFFIIQLLLPWRYLAYPGELFWTEEGYRFSWRVMLIEKLGSTVFTVVDPVKKSSFEVDNKEFLTDFQIKQMATQPDFILQFAHYLRDHYKERGIENPEIYAESYVTLNGRLSRQFINPKINLANEKESFAVKKWIIPFHEKIKGL